jgi:PTS system nitrogen regulatory IIA component
VNLLDLIRGRLVIPSLAAQEKRRAIEEIVDFLVAEGGVPPARREAVLKAVYGREDFMSTGMEHGIALPHGVTDAIDEEVAAIGISKEGIPFDSYDEQPARIIILLLTPTMKALTRVRTLAEIARIVNDPAVREALFRCRSAEELRGPHRRAFRSPPLDRSRARPPLASAPPRAARSSPGGGRSPAPPRRGRARGSGRGAS